MGTNDPQNANRFNGLPYQTPQFITITRNHQHRILSNISKSFPALPVHSSSYIQINIPTTDPSLQEILIAHLSSIGYSGFEEQADAILAFIPESDFDEPQLINVLDDHNLSYSSTLIPPQNWNEVWESNFQPVVLPGFCAIVASFHHQPLEETPYRILINPKMSFGTGHHGTTRLMMTLMRETQITGLNVLDFGSGTGILAILAAKLGARHVLAIDHEEWAIENSIDNIRLNESEGIVDVQGGSLEQATGQTFEVILANINLHILLQYMNELSNLLLPGGTILLSGILTTDEEAITASAALARLQKEQSVFEGDWIALRFLKML